MALIHCSECKGKVSDKALLCPHCGVELQKNTENKLVIKKPGTVYQNIVDEADVPLAQDERRAHKRINIKMMAKINHETARICNISKGGMKLATPVAHTDPKVEIMLDNGEKIINVKGTIRWVSSKRSFSNIIDIGVEISEAPPEYYEFLDQLLVNS
ncbi:MAG: PilZ domain-containing protein [Candidatus Aminicenantes bacterium]|nr:PilZ domain-containing protein [Candidatus Aminicenantes bacterium]